MFPDSIIVTDPVKGRTLVTTYKSWLGDIEVPAEPSVSSNISPEAASKLASNIAAINRPSIKNIDKELTDVGASLQFINDINFKMDLSSIDKFEDEFTRAMNEFMAHMDKFQKKLDEDLNRMSEEIDKSMEEFSRKLDEEMRKLDERL
jgi:hypothetical protein